jgi:hypothetical protein
LQKTLSRESIQNALIKLGFGQAVIVMGILCKPVNYIEWLNVSERQFENVIILKLEI